jgi:hypothetical protein
MWYACDGCVGVKGRGCEGEAVMFGSGVRYGLEEVRR